MGWQRGEGEEEKEDFPWRRRGKEKEEGVGRAGWRGGGEIMFVKSGGGGVWRKKLSVSLDQRQAVVPPNQFLDRAGCGRKEEEGEGEERRD